MNRKHKAAVVVGVVVVVLLGVGACGDDEPARPAGGRDDGAGDISLLSPQTRALREALAGTDRIRVRQGGDPDAPDRLELLYEVQGADAARKVIQMIAFDDQEQLDDSERDDCECWGQLTFQFHDGDTLKAAATYYHGVRLRTSVGDTRGQLTLTPASRRRVREWLIGKGIEEELLGLSPRRPEPDRSE